MSRFIDRDGAGHIVATYGDRQRPDQEELDDDAPELLLDDARKSKRTTIDAAFASALAAGLAYGGKIVQIDDAGRGNIAAAATRALGVVGGVAGMSWPDGFYWRSADNSPLTLTAVQALEMGQAAADRYSALIYRRGALKDAVTAAPTAADVEAIDATSGWD